MTEQPTPPFHNDLAASLDEIWRLLAAAPADPGAPFRTPSLVTVGRQRRPAVRTIVLRDADPGSRTLAVYTDARSGKVADIMDDEAVALLFWDAGRRLQVRLDAAASLHRNDDIAARAWAATPVAARLPYRGPLPPGEPIRDPAEGWPAVTPNPAPGTNDGWANFTVIRARALRLEFLHLASPGHYRALYDWTGGRLAAGWIAP